MLGRLGLLTLSVLGLAACGGSAVNTSEATSFWRQSVARHYHGTVATGDQRGCEKASADHWSCTASLRIAQNSPSSGIDIVGTVTVAGGNLTANAHRATAAEIQAWFAKYRDAQ
jgi:hypothetical protein